VVTFVAWKRSENGPAELSQHHRGPERRTHPTPFPPDADGHARLPISPQCYLLVSIDAAASDSDADTTSPGNLRLVPRTMVAALQERPDLLGSPPGPPTPPRDLGCWKAPNLNRVDCRPDTVQTKIPNKLMAHTHTGRCLNGLLVGGLERWPAPPPARA
jgi:hypothetical protein